ncbi:MULTISPECIES: DUF3817 domain-containing protein [Actinomycetes]|uniref:DUF3817 domain-containing protein n=2 Tax=Actinomycetes TaxID=1760 RepID=A0ABP6LPV4_9MICC|nr:MULTISPECIES: DUF3817 domain-containing protein [unclassified Nesterenkonia]MDS2173259.1 DUF3817 domain-containing protein [Nesterenkonia sp. CL21]OSM43642.1 hypothetical protein BCY76_007390 [Nesterenkonia sp. PF2B19]
MFRSPKIFFRVLAIAEAISWTLLIGGMILRATHGLDVAVTIGGGIHGFVFLAYAATAVIVAKNQRWSAGPAATAIISAIIPYATVPVDIWLKRSGRLDGPWRLHAGEDPRDHSWHDRLLRVLLNRPALVGGALAVGVVVVFVGLLVAGPPVPKG